MPPKPLPLLRHFARRPLPLQSQIQNYIPRTTSQSLPQIAPRSLQSSRIRWNSTQSEAPKEAAPPNKHRNFYKEFGRPVSKVLLLAIFTYQFIYFFWANLEADEIIAAKEAEVKVLENELDEVLGEKGKGKAKVE